jgi:hypothetical protein
VRDLGFYYSTGILENLLQREHKNFVGDQQKKFNQNPIVLLIFACMQAFDFVVMAFCLISFVVYLQTSDLSETGSDDVTMACVRILREVSQFLRLMLFVKK